MAAGSTFLTPEWVGHHDDRKQAKSTRSAEAAEIAAAVLESSRRLASFGGWRTFTEDEDLRDAATTLPRLTR
jgi:hypothetical protein